MPCASRKHRSASLRSCFVRSIDTPLLNQTVMICFYRHRPAQPSGKDVSDPALSLIYFVNILDTEKDHQLSVGTISSSAASSHASTNAGFDTPATRSTRNAGACGADSPIWNRPRKEESAVCTA